MVASAEAGRECRYFKKVLFQANEEDEGAMSLHLDATNSISWSDGSLTKRSRYLAIKDLSLRDCVERQEAEVKYIGSLQNIADGFTKILGRDLFIIFNERLGLVKLESIVEVPFQQLKSSTSTSTAYTGQEGVSKEKKKVRFSDQ